MAVPQYQVSPSTNVGRKGTLLRIRPALQENHTFPRGTVITVPYLGESYVLGVTIYYGSFLTHARPGDFVRDDLAVFRHGQQGRSVVYWYQKATKERMP